MLVLVLVLVSVLNDGTPLTQNRLNYIIEVSRYTIFWRDDSRCVPRPCDVSSGMIAVLFFYKSVFGTFKQKQQWSMRLYRWWRLSYIIPINSLRKKKGAPLT